jgi:hypothetical protein
VVWPAALTIWIFAAVGALGFSPLDEGYVLSQSYRLLAGRVPHVDLISPRPLGSALVHTINFPIPLPLFTTERLMATAEIVAYSMLFARLVFQKPVRDWSFLQVVGAATSALLNIHTFPLMSWYTIDGLLAMALGLNLLSGGLRWGRSWSKYSGLLFLGIAPVMKQSFFLVPLFGLIALVWSSRGSPKRRIARDFLLTGSVLATPAAAYFGFILARGAIMETVTQMTSGRRPLGLRLVTDFANDEARNGLFVALIIILGASILVGILARIKPSEGRDQGWMLLDLPEVALIALAVAAVFAVSINEGMTYGGYWGLSLVWIAAGYLAVQAIVRGRPRPIGIVLVLTAWMAMISWGYAVPNLIAGSLALFVVNELFKQSSLSILGRRTTTAALIPLGLTAGLVVTSVFVAARELNPYLDRPKPELTFRLSEVSQEFGGIRTNEVTGDYLRDIKKCLGEYPARQQAVLPENAAIYPLFRLSNPLPIDWLFPDDTINSTKLIERALTRLDEKGDFLILFQTASNYEIPARHSEVPRADIDTIPFRTPYPYADPILRALKGDRIFCESFVGIYRPASS